MGAGMNAGSRDNEPTSSASMEQAARSLYLAITGQYPSAGQNSRLDTCRATVAAIRNAAVVQAVKRTDPKEATRGN